MEERSKCLQIEIEEELPDLLREATTEVVSFDNHKENNSLPRPRFISRFHPSHASTSDLVYYFILCIAYHTLQRSG